MENLFSHSNNTEIINAALASSFDLKTIDENRTKICPSYTEFFCSPYLIQTINKNKNSRVFEPKGFNRFILINYTYIPIGFLIIAPSNDIQGTFLVFVLFSVFWITFLWFTGKSIHRMLLKRVDSLIQEVKTNSLIDEIH